QARLREAYARLKEARVLWMPNLVTGPAYVRHDGLIQNAVGLLFDTNKWNFFEGGGATLSVESSNALFAPLIARRLVDAQREAARTVSYDIQLQTALAYLDLLRAYGAVAINAESLANSLEMHRLAVAAQKQGFEKTPVDAARLKTEVEIRRQEREDLLAEA